jgi:multidrug efflux pump subunit AcrB
VNDFTRFSRQWKVSVQTAPDARRNPENLFYVRDGKGEMVPLSTLVNELHAACNSRICSR